jgi:dTDP-glucose 4,6-dehydratase
VIPAIITQALASETVHLGNLETSRDFTFVDDTVNGFLCAAQAEDVNGMTINLGTGVGIKISDLVHKILKIIDRPISIVVDAERLRPQDSEVYHLLSNNQLARQMIHWTPQVDFDQGLTETIHWIHDHLDLYRTGVYEF